MNKDNSIKKDLLWAGLSVVGFYILLIVATWVENSFGLSQAYTLVDIAATVVKVATASALAWVLKRLVFASTIGKDFGEQFNIGWKAMEPKEKTRWIIGVFVALFVAISQLT